MARRLALSEQLRREIRKADISLYRLAQEIETTDVLLYRFMGGHGGLSLRTVEKVARVLDLELVKRQAHKGSPKKKKR